MTYMTPFEKHQHDQKLKEKERPTSENKQRIPWASEVMDKMSSNPRSHSVSPVLAWYERENLKRQQGLENEIDLNEILAALKGTRNKWFKAVKSHPKLFDGFTSLESKKPVWSEIKALKGI